MLILNNMDHWASMYDWIYSWKQDDISFYVNEARKSGGPVLELGSGTGRVTIPVASSGIEIVGMDMSPTMLNIAQGKADDQITNTNNLTFIEGDMTSFSLNQKFPLIIIPFRGFLSLLTPEEQTACLNCVKQHLSRDGILIFDVFVPEPDLLSEDSTTPFHFGDVSRPEDGKRLVIWHQNRFDNYNQINNARTIVEQIDEYGEVISRKYLDFQTRYSHRFELQNLLVSCGFRIEYLYGSFEYTPFDPDSSEMIWLASIK